MNAALLRAVFASNLLSIMAGYCIGVVDRAVPYLETEFRMPEGLQSWAFNSLILGAVFGCLFTARPADFKGRKPVMTALALFLLFSVIATGVTSNFLVFCFFRFLSGLAIGGVSVLVPVYLSELAPPASRGKIVLSYPIALIAGILLSFLADYWFRDSGASNWRYMILSGGFPALLFFLFRIFIPESPRFLMQRGLEQETDVVLGRIDPGVDKFLFHQEYKRTVDIKILRKTSKMFEIPLLKPVLFCIMTGMFAMLTGVNSVVHLTSGIAGIAGMSNSSIPWPGLLMGLTGLISIGIALVNVDKNGRRGLMITGSFGMAVCLFTMAVLIWVRIDSLLIQYIVLVFYFFFLGGSLGSVTWVVFPEMFSNTVRIRGVSYGVASFWAFSFLTSLLVSLLSETSAVSVGLIVYGAFTLWGGFFFAKNLTEMKGKKLEEIGIPKSTGSDRA